MANEKAIELAMINTRRKVRVETQLTVDRKKVLSAKLEGIYKRTGELICNGHGPDDLELLDLQERAKNVKQQIEDHEPSPNDATDISELVTKLSSYVIEHISGDIEGTIGEQIYPLMGRVVADSLSSFIGTQHTSLLFLSNNAKQIIIYSMTVGFMLYKLLQAHGLAIVTKEFPVDQDYIDQLTQISAEQRKQIEGLIFGADGDVVSGMTGLDDDEE